MPASASHAPLRVLELFSGIGGWRYALGGLGEVLAAYDISPAGNDTYTLNHGQRPLAREIARVPAATLAGHGADTWLLSPPCQPFCRMGRKGDLEDKRCRAFLHLMEVLVEAPPERLLLENVQGFLGSQAHALLTERLQRGGFQVLEYQLCPSSFGLPNQRPRVYVLASRHGLVEALPPRLAPTPVAGFLDEREDPTLYLTPEVLAKHGPGLDLVRPEALRSACFIGGYGQRLVGSGSFLQTERGIRRFSPTEVARLLGLPATFQFPAEVTLEQRYRLLGNGLSQPVASWALRQLLQLPAGR